MQITRKSLIKKYLSFFKQKEHNIIDGKSLIPENDPSVLFTTAGMHPLVPYILGQEHRQGKRLVNVQRCIRTGDIDEVGDDTHLTFFEMLGNWSLGDYFKKESINYSFEFLTKILNIDLAKLAVTVFEGDDDCSKDQESYEIWHNLGIKRIFFLSKEENFWGPAGSTGPCGVDTEIFFFKGDKPSENINDKNWVEIWNNVFMQYNKDSYGKLQELERKCVDTGMGVERVITILQGHDSVYDTELFKEIINKIAFLSNKEYNNNKDFRIIADHIRTSVFILNENIASSNIEQGYVLRRLLRRSIRLAKKLDIKEGFLKELASIIFEIYNEEDFNKEYIFNQLDKEEKQFNSTLEKGENEFNKIINTLKDKIIDGDLAFKLYDTYGFPIELTQELAKEKDYIVDLEAYKQAFLKHKEKSKSQNSSFKSGLADNSQETIKLHTATHLLHKTLKMVLGEEVKQKGSNITKDRLRFDFSYPNKMTKEQINEVENIINKQIERSLEVTFENMDLNDAKEQNVIALFDAKYEDNVTVYTIGDFSKEVCTGPHVKNIKELGFFKIQKEQSSSAGIRRIKAVLKD